MILTVLLSAAALAGCAHSTPPERFYSLSAGMSAAVAPVAAKAPLYFELAAVSVPQQVNRSQLVVTVGEGRVELLEQQRWAAPLSSEIGQALSLGITTELGAVDVYRTAAPDAAPVYRISASVQRFESAPGKSALVDAVWSVRRAGQTKVLACRTVAEEPVTGSYDELVASHRRAMARLSAAVAKGVLALAAGSNACP
nr:PqiC family protein [Pseudoduganella ginsengisoli]